MYCEKLLLVLDYSIKNELPLHWNDENEDETILANQRATWFSIYKYRFARAKSLLAL